MTLPVRTFSSGPNARVLSRTSCGLAPVLVIVSWKLCALPGLPTALNWLLDSARVLPVGRGEPSLVRMDSASWTAL